MLGIQRHLLDEAQLVAAVEAPLQDVRHGVVVDAAHRDGVDLDRGEPGIRRSLETEFDVGESVPSREPREGLGVDRVEADVDPVQTRAGEALGDALEAHPVGRHRDPRARLERGDAGHEVDEGSSQQGLAAGQAHLRDAVTDEEPDEPEHLLVGEHLRLRHPGQALGGHAVGAAQVAAVGHRDAQVSGHPAELVRPGRSAQPAC